MAASSKDTRNEDIRIYIISVFLFACILVGGVFLGLSIVNTGLTWLPTVGMVFVGAPWIFWLFVYIYSCCRPRLQFISKTSAPNSPTMSAENPGGATTVVVVEEEEEEGASEIGDVVHRVEPAESRSNMELSGSNSYSGVSQGSEKAIASTMKS